MNHIKLVAKDDDPNLSFEQWARNKYNEIIKILQITNDQGELDPEMINVSLTQFSQHFAWAITIQEIETNKLNVMTHDYEQWHNENFNKVFRVLREEAAGAGRAPAQATVEARLAQLHGEEKQTRLFGIETQKSRVDTLKGFVKVLEKQANMLQTLCGNMRSELFFAAGVPLQDRMSPHGKTQAAKAILHQAMRGQGDGQSHQALDS